MSIVNVPVRTKICILCVFERRELGLRSSFAILEEEFWSQRKQKNEFFFPPGLKKKLTLARSPVFLRAGESPRTNDGGAGAFLGAFYSFEQLILALENAFVPPTMRIKVISLRKKHTQGHALNERHPTRSIAWTMLTTILFSFSSTLLLKKKTGPRSHRGLCRGRAAASS